MKKVVITTLLLTVSLLVSSCSTTKRYVEIQDIDYVMVYGKDRFKVTTGDILEVIQIKPCRGNYYETCWKVRNVETGLTGYVMADKMEERHRVYIEEEKK